MPVLYANHGRLCLHTCNPHACVHACVNAEPRLVQPPTTSPQHCRIHAQAVAAAHLPDADRCRAQQLVRPGPVRHPQLDCHAVSLRHQCEVARVAPKVGRPAAACAQPPTSDRSVGGLGGMQCQRSERKCLKRPVMLAPTALASPPMWKRCGACIGWQKKARRPDQHDLAPTTHLHTCRTAAWSGWRTASSRTRPAYQTSLCPSGPGPTSLQTMWENQVSWVTAAQQTRVVEGPRRQPHTPANQASGPSRRRWLHYSLLIDICPAMA